MPSGNIATGTLNRIARTNAALGGNLPELLSMPIRPGAGTTVYLRDIGSIENGTDLITAYAHVNGRRTVYIPVTKRADASTVSVINAVKAAIPDFKKAVPDDVDVRLEFDQSPYVRNSIRGLVMEGLLGAALTGLMVLIFLRDWRRALLVILNIPFARGARSSCGYRSNDQHQRSAAWPAVGVLVDGRRSRSRTAHADVARSVDCCAVVEACSHGVARLLHVLHTASSLVSRRVWDPAFLCRCLRSGIFHDRLPAVEQPGSGLRRG
jgi:hypothetical protein